MRALSLVRFRQRPLEIGGGGGGGGGFAAVVDVDAVIFGMAAAVADGGDGGGGDGDDVPRVGLPQGTRARAVTPRRGMGTHDDDDDVSVL